MRFPIGAWFILMFRRGVLSAQNMEQAEQSEMVLKLQDLWQNLRSGLTKATKYTEHKEDIANFLAECELIVNSLSENPDALYLLRAELEDAAQIATSVWFPTSSYTGPWQDLEE